MSKFLYGAYSLDLLSDDFRKHFKHYKYICNAILPNHQLVYRGLEGEGILTIEQYLEKNVKLKIYELNERELVTLHELMNYPNVHSATYKAIKVDGITSTVMLYYISDRFDYNLPNKEMEKKYEDCYKTCKFPVEALETAYMKTYDKMELVRKRQ